MSSVSGAVSGLRNGHLDSVIATEPFSVVTALDTILETAVRERVSDIHLSADSGGLAVRFRVDGVMERVASIPRLHQDELIARIKVLAGLRTDEHFTAQDGRFSFQLDKEGCIDIRVSILPIYDGPNCVLRLLKTDVEITVENLGFSEPEALLIDRAIHNPYGLIIVTGPTGSGKTTTLYALLKEINTPKKTIITIEDPIEYVLPGANQIVVNNQVGLNFATGLRSIVRQDPDVIMVGEVRDTETAKLATTAALTGHMVLTTLHTNDAPSALTRLLEMGVEPYLVASTVSIIVAQRLVRRLCPYCKVSDTLTLAEKERLGALLPSTSVPDVVSREVGCDLCRGSGYQGRLPIYEVCPITSELREHILSCQPAFVLREVATTYGMGSLLLSGLERISKQETSLAELLAVIYE